MRDKEQPKDTVTAFAWRPRDPNKTENVLVASYTSNKIIHWLSTTGNFFRSVRKTHLANRKKIDSY